MKKPSILFRCLIIIILFSFTACNRPFLYGQKEQLPGLTTQVHGSPAQVLQAAKKALEQSGYMVQTETENSLETSWQSTTPDSHYVEYFGRQDHGTVGAYHRILVQVTADGENSKVSVASVIKSIVSNLKSTGYEEKKIVKKLNDFTRPSDVQVTNIGIR